MPNSYHDLSHLKSFAGAVVASLSSTQKKAGSNPLTVMTNIFSVVFAKEMKRFCEFHSIQSVDRAIRAAAL